MTFDEYQHEAMKTASPTADLTNMALGLCGEAGEVADLIKKFYYQGHTADPHAKLAEELGDIMWYLALGARCLGISLEDIAVSNIQKLRVRYGEKFDPAKSIKRNEMHEAAVRAVVNGVDTTFNTAWPADYVPPEEP